MTQDILMAHDDPVAPSSDTARNQLQQVFQLAKNVHGADCLELIIQVLETPGIYVFAELIALPNIQELKNGADVKHFNTLNLFAYGTYKQYRANPSEYLDLTATMQKKLQHLTIVSLAIENKSIPYAVLLDELQIDNVRHLEDIIIEAIYADIIRGKLFQNHRILEIEYAQGRDIPLGYTRKIATTLQEWVNSCDAISSCIDQQIERANSEKEKRLRHKDNIEIEINNLKKTLKTQCNDDDAMQIDVRDGSSTSQEARRKTCRAKGSRPSGKSSAAARSSRAGCSKKDLEKGFHEAL